MPQVCSRDSSGGRETEPQTITVLGQEYQFPPRSPGFIRYTPPGGGGGTSAPLTPLEADRSLQLRTMALVRIHVHTTVLVRRDSNQRISNAERKEFLTRNGRRGKKKLTSGHSRPPHGLYLVCRHLQGRLHHVRQPYGAGQPCRLACWPRTHSEGLDGPRWPRSCL